MRRTTLALLCGLAAHACPQPTVYVVGTGHLDTQWLWTIQDTIRDHLPKTMRHNLEAFERHPAYVFSFEGSFRYQLMKEYYPELFARVRERVREGRWRVAGSWVDAVDVNVPSPESLIRHALYGNGFFRREFGRSSVDVFLPDCFGFGAALPTVAAHCGLKGFSTQKLTWGSAVGIPFPVGQWEGIDGSRIVAALDGGSYVGDCGPDWDRAEWLMDAIRKASGSGGPRVAYRYHGAGDTGGGPSERSLRNLEASMRGAGPIRVRSAGSDQLFRDLSPSDAAKLPLYRGELLMTAHGTGCYTSQAAMKEWNKRNELLADAAERAAVAAWLLAGKPYPRAVLQDAWVRFLWHQFHDDLTGTSIPQAYEFSWNDELLAMNRFADVLTSSLAAWCRRMDTRGPGLPVVVFNPSDRPRAGLVRLRLPAKEGWVALDPQGRARAVQTLSRRGSEVEAAFRAEAPAVGLAVYRLVSRRTPDPAGSLRADDRTLENDRLRVRVDDNGDVASVFDKRLRRELLRAPIRLQMLDNVSPHWAAWEILYDAVAKPPREFVGASEGPRLVERGPLRATIESRDRRAGSSFVRRVSLEAGDSARLEFQIDVDWRSRATLLKAAFPLAVRNAKATYDLGLGAIERGVNTRRLYEVPAQEWADLTDGSRVFGAAVLTQAKYGWDRPDDGTLRLTLLHTADGRGNWRFQETADFGRHTVRFALFPHQGDWRGSVWREAHEFNRPMMAFRVQTHPGDLGRSFGLVRSVPDGCTLSALKLAEDRTEVVARLFQRTGQPGRGLLSLAAPLRGAHPLLGDEQPAAGSLSVGPTGCDLRLRPFRPVTVGLRVAAASRREPIPARAFGLPGGAPIAALALDARGRRIPPGLWPNATESGGLRFALGLQATVCKGQTVRLPSGGNRVSLLVASTSGSVPSELRIDGVAKRILVPAATGWVGQWWRPQAGRGEPAPPFAPQTPVAWYATHTNLPDGSFDPYRFAYLHRVDVTVPEDARTMVLPNDRRIVVAAAVRWRDSEELRPAEPIVR
ncbi:MAG: hypothetical protein N2109_07255 [Fimbriimonadales bacterium]|nr:hypothetical protein [Fimbriimonadales bacterium]